MTVAAPEPEKRTAGYSGTPLARKLGIKPGGYVGIIAAPKEYRIWLQPLPPETVIETKSPRTRCDIVHLFVRSRAELECELPRARRMLKTDGAIWVSWPKKSSGIPSDISENDIRDRALRGDLVDVKVCAVTEVWSGLKLVVRKHLR